MRTKTIVAFASPRSRSRTKTRRSGSRCDPARAQTQPFSGVASSRANQSPTTVWSGSVLKKVASWWDVTAPPCSGGLKMYIDWGSTGRS